jgi:N,N-dimethylformamidase
MKSKKVLTHQEDALMHKGLSLFVHSLAVLAMALMLSSHSSASADSPRTLIGYSSKITARPGDTLDFMVNAIEGGKYRADLVRIVNGDYLSHYRDQFKVVDVEASFAREYDGVAQALNLGSYVEIPASRKLDGLKSFTVSAWIYPTFDPNEYKEPDLENPDPFYPPTLDIAKSIGDQTIVSRFDALTNTGWALRINKNFQLEFISGDGQQLESVTLVDTVRDWDWSYVAVSYDADSGKAKVLLLEKPYAPGDQFTARNLSKEQAIRPVVQEGSLRIAALRNGKGAAMAKIEKPGDVFNGRIQDVRIADKALTDKQVDALSAAVAPKDINRSLVADWDFSQNMKTDQIIDIRGKNNGTLINVAERAVRGRFWKAGTLNWQDKPEDYDAIIFHADDLYDAQWQVDFSYTVPNGLKSGFYAARLKRDGDTNTSAEYIVFIVAPAKDEPKAKLALWISEYNYLAYSNVSIGATAAKNFPSHWFNERDNDFMRNNREYISGGVYNAHVDGTYFIYGSRLRPDLHMKPSGSAIYNFSQDTHITSFLEASGIEYDIITDELIDAEGIELLSQYTVVLTATHPEYITAAEFDATAQYTAQGGRLMYVGGNGFFWAVETNPAFPGALESRNFSNLTERYLTNGNRGGLMIETGRPPGPLLGNEMSGMIWHGASPYRKLPAAKESRAAWIFAGTKEGDVFGKYGVDHHKPGAAGAEIDRYNPGNGVPRHALQLATSEPLNKTIENVILIDSLPLVIAYDPPSGDTWAQADLVFFETANGGAVFSTGSIAWMSATLENDYNNDVATITRNVINRFLDPKPFPPIPETAVEDVERAPRNPEYENADGR